VLLDAPNDACWLLGREDLRRLGGEVLDPPVGLEVVLDPRRPRRARCSKVCELYPFMWRYDAGMPRSPNSQVTWWVGSGDRDPKSQTLSASWLPVYGSRFWVWMKLGNLMASFMKNNRGVVADEILIAVLRTGLQRESARFAGCVTSALPSQRASHVASFR
jgi:hypothetical protein